jgi:hypothetical protein
MERTEFGLDPFAADSVTQVAPIRCDEIVMSAVDPEWTIADRE